MLVSLSMEIAMENSGFFFSDPQFLLHCHHWQVAMAEIASPLTRLKAAPAALPRGRRAAAGSQASPRDPPAGEAGSTKRLPAPVFVSGSLFRLRLQIVKYTLGFCSLPL